MKDFMILFFIFYGMQLLVMVIDLVTGEEIFIKKKKDIIYFITPVLMWIIGFVIMIKSIIKTWRRLG